MCYLNFSCRYNVVGFRKSGHNWITIYSPVVLKSILSQGDYRCRLLFVCALSLLCSRKTDVTSAGMSLLQYCCQCKHLYGPTSFTFNMHLHLHLKEIFFDYGPLHALLCFALKCYSGILGSYHTSKRQIESQIMTILSK